ncbi:hypothetical protein OHB44_09950 [Micromonospora sp. NBC_00821]|uniref:hypothetical protein n=1 Tax=Micromonospora sp. NBC_00821 TaxID=2975977 RepID=UPI002ED6B10D|nr:hypothetical protein OHB44_09950 [Micromonospora sp. NBC_00821]
MVGAGLPQPAGEVSGGAVFLLGWVPAVPLWGWAMPAGQHRCGVLGRGDAGGDGEVVDEGSGEAAGEQVGVRYGGVVLLVGVDAEDLTPAAGEADHGVGVGVFAGVGLAPDVTQVAQAFASEDAGDGGADGGGRLCW